ncbi:MAG: chemotaxis response regulator protein-glutamate methylesterase [Tissierellia bacterium]|nr:chemotaxis response regulator protein-glutamate methylesterase [Tissierellia bacterium]
MIKVLIVDDSPFMRKILTDIIQEDKEIVVIGEARNGKEALEKIPILNPDLITLDVEMPIMDGITTLRHIVKKYKLPVIMISSLTVEDAELTIEALEKGAVDFIAKPKNIFNLSEETIKYEIIDKIKAGAQSKTILKYKKTSKAEEIKEIKPIKGLTKSKPLDKKDYDYIISIGTSTGGPRALQNVLPLIPKNINGTIVVVQHMPANFTKSLADRLNNQSNIIVKEGEDGEILKRGYCYIAPGGYHMLVKKKAGEYIIELNQEPAIKGLRPSADILMESISKLDDLKKIAIIMTGMGSDGSKGIVDIKNSNGYIMAQDEDTSVVFGMPKAAIETNVVDKIVSLENIAYEITRLVEV